MSPAVKNGLMIGVLVIAVIIAGFYFTKEDEESAYPTDDSVQYTLMCDETGDKFTLNAKEYNEWLHDPEKLYRDPETGAMAFLNPNTGKYTVVSASVHKPTGIWYILQDSKGNPVDVPKEVEEYDLEQAKKAAGG